MTTLDPAGLVDLHDRMADHVATGQMPGLVTLVAAGEDVHVDVIGSRAFTDPTPMPRDAIFRIASLTKPITAVAAMAMVDDGTLRLDQPIDDLVPELADRRVLRSIDAELDDTVAARRSITLEDLLSFRLGLGSIMAMPGTYPIQRAEDALELHSISGPPWPPGPHDPDSWIAALGTVPLVHQPGERWLYNTSAQVLGVLLARAGGTDLPTVFRDRIFEPLGMDDTGFHVPADRLDRFTTLYAPDRETGEPIAIDEPATSWWRQPPRFPDASGWLVSTIDDYWRFVSVLRDAGTSDGTRILSPESARLMVTDRLTADQREAAGVFLPAHTGWGLGLATPAAGSSNQPLPFGFGWDGGSGTSWRTNPELDITAIVLTQRQMQSPEPPAAFQDLWDGVNAALA